MQLLFAVACAMIVTAATANSASPELGLSRDVVVEVFDGKNCVGKQRRVKMGDFVGGNHDNGWDSCGDAWDDSTAMRWPWWGSFRVAAGHAVRTGSKCYDSSNKANPEPQEVGMTSEAGCVSPNYTFTYVSLAPAPLPPPLPPQSPPQLPPSPPPLPPPPAAAASTAAAAFPASTSFPLALADASIFPNGSCRRHCELTGPDWGAVGTDHRCTDPRCCSRADFPSSSSPLAKPGKL